MTDDNDGPRGLRVSRRQVLSLGAAAGVAVGTGTIRVTSANTSPPAPQMPEVKIAALAAIEPGAEIAFSYPDPRSPAILLRLEAAVEGGVGPDQSIVAYSRLCTHKGCPVAWNARQKMLICPCHWSSFDPALKGRLIIGQASQGLAQIILRVSAADVYAVGVDGLIYGRQTNIL